MNKVSLVFIKKDCMSVCPTRCIQFGGQKNIAAVFEAPA